MAWKNTINHFIVTIYLAEFIFISSSFSLISTYYSEVDLEQCKVMLIEQSYSNSLRDRKNVRIAQSSNYSDSNHRGFLLGDLKILFEVAIVRILRVCTKQS